MKNSLQVAVVLSSLTAVLTLIAIPTVPTTVSTSAPMAPKASAPVEPPRHILTPKQETNLRNEMRVQWQSVKESDYQDEDLQAKLLNTATTLMESLGDDPEALKAAGDVLYHMKRRDVQPMTETIMARYLAVVPDDLEYQFRYSSALFMNRKFEKAKGKAEELAAKDPGNFDALRMIALCSAGLGDKEGMEKAYSNAAPHAPSPEQLAFLRKGIDDFFEMQKDPRFLKAK